MPKRRDHEWMAGVGILLMPACAFGGGWLMHRIGDLPALAIFAAVSVGAFLIYDRFGRQSNHREAVAFWCVMASAPFLMGLLVLLIYG